LTPARDFAPNFRQRQIVNKKKPICAINAHCQNIVSGIEPRNIINYFNNLLAIYRFMADHGFVSRSVMISFKNRYCDITIA